MLGLRPFVYKDGDIIPDPKATFPDFIELVNYISNATNDKKSENNDSGTRYLVYTPVVFEEILKFIRNSLKVSSAMKEVETFKFVEDLLSSGKVSIQYFLLFRQRESYI
jgi:hypothetical protein